MPEIVQVEHFPGETSPDMTNDVDVDVYVEGDGEEEEEERERARVVAEATAAAAQAAVVAARAAERVVRLAGGYGRVSRVEDKAAVLIQSCYRGYLVIFLFFYLIFKNYYYYLFCKLIKFINK